MKLIFKISIYILLVWIIILLSCKKDLISLGEVNKPPATNAGPDQSIQLPIDSVILDGSASRDPDGTISSWLWTKISGPTSFNIIKPSDSTTKVKTLVKGTYLFELKVTDNGGLSAKDTMMVIVDSGVTTKHPPIANAGADQSITLPTNTVNLNGNSSTDPDNNITTYAWSKISGPSSFNIANANVVQTQVTNLVQGTYQFELKVTDAGGLFSKDTMQVMVNTISQDNCGALSQIAIGTLSISRNPVSILTAGNKIVFAGGFVGASGPPLYGASPRVDIYDKSTQSWSTADLSMTRFHIGTIASGNQIFFAGGDNGHPCSRVDIYDASNNTWSTTELSETREAVIAVATGNKVLFAGGITNTGYSNKVDIYDQLNGTWSTTTLSRPTGGSYIGKYEIDRSGVISVDNKIYFNTGDVYDALANTWSIQAALSGGAVVSLGNKIYLSGTIPSTISPGYPNTMEIYNTSANSWSSTNMLQPRSDITAIAADNKIFWAGGEDSSWVLNLEEYLRCLSNIEIYDVNTNSHLLHNIPFQVCGVRAIKTNNKIFFAVLNNYTEIYDINSHSWSSCNSYFFQSLAIGNTVYQLGADNLHVWKLEF